MKYLIRGVVNGSTINIGELGINGSEIKQVWTIIDEQKLLTQYDTNTGVSRTVDLQDCKPLHWHSAFLEERMHDWTIRGDNKDQLHFHGHSGATGEVHDLLIVTENKA